MKLPKFLRRSYWNPKMQDWLWAFLSPSWTLSSGVSVSLSDRSDWITFGDVFVNREYDKAIAGSLQGALMTQTFQVVDLGANVGSFYLRFLHLYLSGGSTFAVHYTAVEPNPKCLARFARNLKENKNININVRTIEGLAGLRQGQGIFEVDNFHIGSRVVKASAGHQGRRLSYIDLAKELPEGPIALLKVDIEGSEEMFVTEYQDLLARAQILIIEIHSNLCDADVCREMIGVAGLHRVHMFKATEHFTLELYQREHDKFLNPQSQ